MDSMCPTQAVNIFSMWLATQHGFYSIVQKDVDVYFVRARVRKDLVNLVVLLNIDNELLEWEGADYRYRIIVNRQVFLEIMIKLATTLDYPNFKGRIHERTEQSHKLPAYHRMWATMAELQER